MCRALLLGALLLAPMAAGCIVFSSGACQPLTLVQAAERGDGVMRFDAKITACDGPLHVRTGGCRPQSELYPVVNVDGREYHVGYQLSAVPENERRCDPLYDPTISYTIPDGESRSRAGISWDGTVSERADDRAPRKLAGPQTLRVSAGGHEAKLVVELTG